MSEKGWTVEECAAAIRAGDDPLTVLRYVVAAEKARADAAEREYAVIKKALGVACKAGEQAESDLAAARRENDDLTGRAMIRNGLLRAALERIAAGTADPKEVARAAPAAPAAGEEGKR